MTRYRFATASPWDRSEHAQVLLTADPGNDEFLDLHGFGPLNPDVELEDLDEVVELSDLKLFIEYVDKRFEGARPLLACDCVSESRRMYQTKKIDSGLLREAGSFRDI
jgi:hypothetical protein